MIVRGRQPRQQVVPETRKKIGQKGHLKPAYVIFKRCADVFNKQFFLFQQLDRVYGAVFFDVIQELANGGECCFKPCPFRGRKGLYNQRKTGVKFASVCKIIGFFEECAVIGVGYRCFQRFDERGKLARNFSVVYFFTKLKKLDILPDKRVIGRAGRDGFQKQFIIAVCFYFALAVAGKHTVELSCAGV